MDGWRSVPPKTSHVIAIRKIETPRMVARGAGECGDGIFFALRDRVLIPCGSEAESVSNLPHRYLLPPGSTSALLLLGVVAAFGLSLLLTLGRRRLERRNTFLALPRFFGATSSGGTAVFI